MNNFIDNDFKLPNGYGRISKLSGNRRFPYYAYANAGYKTNSKGKKVCNYKMIGKGRTREEALELLNMYHCTNRDYNYELPTFATVFHMFMEDKYRSHPTTTMKEYKIVFKLCKDIHNQTFIHIKTKDMQRVIDTCGKNYPMLRKLLTLFRMMYKYGLSNDLCIVNRSDYLDISKYKYKNPAKRERKIFKKEELDILWNHSDLPYYQVILILIYSGLRIGELLNLKKEDVHLDEHYLYIRSSKTFSGIRNVPIANKIYPYVVMWYNSSDCEYLIHTFNNKQLLYRNYYDAYFKPIMKEHNLDLRPHFCRHTCISLLATAGVDERIVKKIVGHSSNNNVTTHIYTHFDIRVLLDAINKI